MSDHQVLSAGTGAPAPGLSLAERLASAVAGCRDVVGLSEGPFGEIATHLAGRRIRGVRIEQDLVEVHVIARLGPALPAVAEQVRAACRPLAEGRPVDVTIDDVIIGPETVPSVDDRGRPPLGTPPIL